MRSDSIFKHDGAHLPEQSMWDLLARVDELVAQPVLKQMHAGLLGEDVLHADETSVTMRTDDGRGTKRGCAWGWRNLRREGTPSKALVDFRTSRGRGGPIRFLGAWSGTLIADGYAGYDEVIEKNGIRRAGCRAQARRKLEEAVDTGSTDAEGVLALVQRPFAVERPINEAVQNGEVDRERQLELRRAARANESPSVGDAIYAEAGRLEGLRSTLPKARLGRALGDLFAQRAAPTAFLDDLRLPSPNNDAERDPWHPAVGRKNWLVSGSQRGGEVAGRLHPLVLPCKQCGADPEAYLEDVLGRVATTPASAIASLTPWAWARQRRAASGVED